MGSGRRRQDPLNPAQPGPDFEISLDLLGSAAAALSAIQKRCDLLERTVAAETGRFRSELATMSELAKEWERRATTVKAQLTDREAELTELRIRADTSAIRAEQAEARLIVAEQEAAEAVRQVKMFHDKIMEAFGGRI